MYSEKGARNSGPIAYPIRYIPSARLINSLDVLSSRIIPSSPMVNVLYILFWLELNHNSISYLMVH